jgi:TM2 domain-containing membrane protein YozV
MEGQGRGKQKIVAGLLGILLGGLGVHHFYLGSTMAGVIELIATFVTCGVASLVGLIEGILILVMSDGDFDARYNARTPGSTEFVFMKPQ